MKNLKITKQITNREVGSVDKYLKDITKLGLIDATEEIELSKRIKNGDKSAFDKLIRSNLRFVITVAKQYQGMGLEFEDLISEGNIGLIKAAQKFDETKGFKFISYAVWWIRQSILKAIAEQSRVVHLPINKVNKITKVNKAIIYLEKDLGREPTIQDISIYLEMKEIDIENCIRFSNKHTSMDRPINEDGDSLYEVYENKESVKPDSDLMDISLKQNISDVLSTLSERESIILEKHFGLNGEIPISLEEIAESMNLTKERIRQIKQKSLYKIRNSMKGDLLKSGL
jgi:RNA polymerase primary sigma factor